jgi:tRNA threonylcarbamoyladenosine biosynthesis protein TsaB
VLALLSLALLGCAGGTGANDDTAKSGSEDEGHPLVPAAYAGLWDIESLGCDVLRAGCFVFCAGPGSLLGIRTTAVLLRTWTTLKPRPCFSYQSLEMVARGPQASGMAVIADARRDSWHLVARDAQGTPLPVQRVPAQDLPAMRCMPEHFRHWAPLPSGTRRVPYDVGELLRATADVPLLQESPEPEAFLHEDPQYVTWTPRVHQAPSSPPAPADAD